MNYNYESFNDELMKHVSTVVATLILLTTASSGCLENGFFGNENNESALASPIGKKETWEYSVTIDNKQFSTTMVVSIDDDDSDYYIGAEILTMQKGMQS